MPDFEIIKFTLIYLFFPGIGLVIYLWMNREMTRFEPNILRSIELFAVFATYGALLILALTSLFWYWSAMATIGAVYLFIGAPVIMGFIAFKYYIKRNESRYQLFLFRSGALYFIILPMVFTVLFAFRHY
jgi:hypothetical protein